ncbi:sensor histidine kinase [Olivibacter sitiensis]|uniref:sensor histidine kinase n=1 Tax=Olivibacter sitiensis TaxID=376470 RepID=UPI000412FBFC|nr:histidine kinase [Olivibacter sitiensis]
MNTDSTYKCFSSQYSFVVAFWSLYFLYEWLTQASMSDEYARYLLWASVMVPITMLTGLLIVHLYFNRFYMRGRKELFWICLVLTILIALVLRRWFYYGYTYPRYYPELLVQPFFYLPKMIIDMVNMCLIVALYSLIHFFRAYFEQQKLTESLQKENIRSELELLKMQVHPHFIFNTLNNIYSFSIQQNPATPSLIHGLSTFLDYNLYSSKQHTVALETELEYIKNYMELEKIRCANRLDISVNTLTPITGFHISPMLILPFIENAFKHGVAKEKSASWIRVDVAVRQDRLKLTIENSCPTGANTTADKRSGIGLQNVKRRLEILYDGSHKIDFLKSEGAFLVILELPNIVV